MSTNRFSFSLQNAQSPYDDYCDGYGNPGASGSSYLTALYIGVGKVQEELSHAGSSLLDEINAFDRAEIDGAYLGQINMITVSSFCGPMGAIWGYDLVPSQKIRRRHPDFAEGEVSSGGKSIPVYTAQPLFDATKALFGTVKKKQFPLFPGAHVPCAKKVITCHGPIHLYCCIGVGIAEDRKHVSNLFMEDVGSIHASFDTPTKERAYRHMILANKAKSIVKIAQNHGISFKEIFVGMKDITVLEGEVGCALVATPYFTLARKAIPTKKDIEKLSLENWRALL